MPEGYVVVAQRETAGVLADGRVGPIMEVTFQTSGGVTAKVEVPVDVFSVDVVEHMIRERVAGIARVSNLRGVVDDDS